LFDVIVAMLCLTTITSKYNNNVNQSITTALHQAKHNNNDIKQSITTTASNKA
jgi:hypothetical protein